LRKLSEKIKSWEETLFDDLEDLDDVDRILALGEAISRMNPVSSALAARRRMVMVNLIESGQYSATSLAQTIGFRVQTVRRLVDEGRAQRRMDVLDEAA
jgi:hypothetical protein